MTGRAEVDRQRKRLDATFKRVSGVKDDPELLSDLARYFCVLVSGFLEQAVIELILEYVNLRCPESIQRHVAQRMRRFTTANATNLTQLLGSFDLDWQRDLEAYMVDEYKDAVDSVVNLRHTVSHGRFTGVTMVSVERYYDRVKDVVNHIADLCVPV
jgi:hypothetical protein